MLAPRLIRSLTRTGCLAAITTMLVACGVGKNGVAPTQLDLGSAPAVQPGSSVASTPPVVVPVASSAALLSQTMVVWRVGNEGQPRAYATYQWVAPPAKLFRQRVIDRLSQQGAVLQQGVGADMPTIRLDLQRFEQTFSLDGTRSEGHVTAQAVMVQGSQYLDRLLIDIKVTAPSQDAEGGAIALRQATDQAAEQIARWVSATLSAPSQTTRTTPSKP
jgi:ABC-type uncharacterized transport system auxiliary subunit